MDVTPHVSAEFQLINGYGDGGFTIAGTRHEGAVLVLPRRTLAWPVTAISGIAEDSLSPILQAEPRPKVLVLGCGKGMQVLPRPVRDFLRGAGIVVEPMDTGAACRTFNVLLTEGRDVAAALFPV